MAAGSTPIAGVNISVENSVKGHSRRAGRNHGDHNPQKPPAQIAYLEAVIAPRQQSPSKREGQREYGMLKLDHVKRQP